MFERVLNMPLQTSNPVATYLCKVSNKDTTANSWRLFQFLIFLTLDKHVLTMSPLTNWTCHASGRSFYFKIFTFRCKFSKCSQPSQLFKVNNENVKTICEICSKLTIKTLERRRWHRCSEQISHIALIFPLIILNK